MTSGKRELDTLWWRCLNHDRTPGLRVLKVDLLLSIFHFGGFWCPF